MKLRKLLPILAFVMTLLSFAPGAARAEEKPGLRSPASFLLDPDTPREFWTRDGLGYWLNGFKWIGFDDWSFELRTEEPSRGLTYAPVVLLLRVPRGDIQPYMGILPYLTMSGGGLDLHVNGPGVMFGLCWSF